MCETLAEWLRRLTRNLQDNARAGSSVGGGKQLFPITNKNEKSPNLQACFLPLFLPLFRQIFLLACPPYRATKGVKPFERNLMEVSKVSIGN